jgi:hypothetical protein
VSAAWSAKNFKASILVGGEELGQEHSPEQARENPHRQEETRAFSRAAFPLPNCLKREDSWTRNAARDNNAQAAIGKVR